METGDFLSAALDRSIVQQKGVVLRVPATGRSFSSFPTGIGRLELDSAGEVQCDGFRSEVDKRFSK